MNLRTTLVFCTALTAIAAPATAATLRLDAQDAPLTQWSDFSIIFDDADGDGTVSLDEVLSFSGVTSLPQNQFYGELLRLPVIAGFVDGEILTTSSGAQFNTWLFAQGEDQRASVPITTFTLTVTPVPVPAAGLMLVAGIGGLMALRRRKDASAIGHVHS